MRRGVTSVVLVAMVVTGNAYAQPSRGPGRKGPFPVIPQIEVPGQPLRELGKLRERFGVAGAQRLLLSLDPSEHLRGVRRLASIGTPQAIDLLVRSQDAGSFGARDLRAKLEAIRGLAGHASEDGPRQALLNAMADAVRALPSEEGELWPMVRDTAALGLAKNGGARGVESLAGVARQGGALGESAARALLAYPPIELSWLLGSRAAITKPLAKLLGELGDLRAIDALRGAVREGDPETRAESLVSLARLGDSQAAPIARAWAKVTDPIAQMAAARALVRVAGSEGRTLVAKLLTTEATRDEAMVLALSSPGQELVEALSALAHASAREVRRDAITALGRSGDTRSVAAIVALLGDVDVGAEAALALAQGPGAASRRAIEDALQNPTLRANALRAGTMRALSLGDRPSSLVKVARAALSDPKAAAAAAFALVALGEVDADDPSLISRPELLGAITRGAMGAGDASLAKLIPLLMSADDRRHRDAFGAALISAADGADVPTARLLTWVEEGGAVAPLAVRAIATRDDPTTRSRVLALLSSGDPMVRAHVALGLGRSPEHDAAGILANAYSFESDLRARRAIVRALAMRDEPVRAATLALAAHYDPDEGIRALALAATSRTISPPKSGRDVAWIVIDGDPSNASFRLWRSDDLAVPALADDDGALLVPGLSTGGSRANVASFLSPSRPK